MDCFIGAATGAFKGANLRENTVHNYINIKSLDPKQDEIKSMTWLDEDKDTIIYSKKNNSLHKFNVNNENCEQISVIDGCDGTIIGIAINKKRIITCDEGGNLRIMGDDYQICKEFLVGKEITSIRGSRIKDELVVGSNQVLSKLWDINVGKQTWSAKNVSRDMLGLEYPPLVTDIRFVNDENYILEATKHHEMRLYDPRAQRKPVKRINFMENPITALSLSYKANNIIAANSIGEIGYFDIRSKVHPICKFKGQSGSIRSIDAHPTLPLFCSVGIDRFLRVHDINSRKLVHKIYCKARLNCVLLKDQLTILAKAKIENCEDDEEYGKMETSYVVNKEEDESNSDDDVWNNLNQSEIKTESADDIEIMHEEVQSNKRKSIAPLKKIKKKKKT